MNEWLLWIITQIASVDWLLRNLIAGLAMLVETSIFIGLLIPGDTIVLLAAVGVSGPIDFIGLLAFVVGGSLIGETVGFFIGRLFGERIRYSWLGRRLGESNWIIADRFVETRGGIAVAVSRFLPIFHALVPVVSGMTRMRYRRFIVWTVAACTIWSSIYICLGLLARTSADQLVSRLNGGSFLFVGLVLLFSIGFHLAKKRLLAEAEQMAGEAERKPD